jgi:hypothetical protein
MGQMTETVFYAPFHITYLCKYRLIKVSQLVEFPLNPPSAVIFMTRRYRAKDMEIRRRI